MGLVRETLAAEAVLPSSSISYGDAIEVVKRSRPDVCIVGIGRSLDAALALAQALSKEAPKVTLVALANTSSADVILSAMRVGYKEYVVLPNDAQRLRQVVHDTAYAPDDDDEKGLVISVAGAKGGVGSTLIATHLAAELAAIHRVLCVDMDFSMGDAATMLDLTPKDNIIDLLPRADRLDERMLTASIAMHRSKVHVLPQPNDLEKVEGINPDDVYSVIHTAAKAYQYVLIDVGMHTDSATEVCFGVSDIIVLVTTPDVISVRDAFRRLKLLERLGIEKERVKLVVNRHRQLAGEDRGHPVQPAGPRVRVHLGRPEDRGDRHQRGQAAAGSEPQVRSRPGSLLHGRDRDRQHRGRARGRPVDWGGRLLRQLVR